MKELLNFKLFQRLISLTGKTITFKVAECGYIKGFVSDVGRVPIHVEMTDCEYLISYDNLATTTNCVSDFNAEEVDLVYDKYEDKTFLQFTGKINEDEVVFLAESLSRTEFIVPIVVCEDYT